MKLLKCLPVFVFCFYTSITLASVVHHIQYDQLVGATGIEINGEVYQVQFADSSCILLFNDCDETTDFFFPDAQSGLEANLALLEQVLLDLPSGLFDSEPELTHGCYSHIQCSIVTPVGSVAPQLEVFPAVFLINKKDQRNDVHAGSGSTFRASDFGLRNSNADTLTYAIWSKYVGANVSVPIPTSLFLFSSAVIRQSEVDEFNEQANYDLEKIRDFIILHYKVTNRNDSEYWRHCQNMEVPASLAHRIEVFKETGHVFRSPNELFDDSWQQVMYGQGLMPDLHHALVDTMSKKELTDFLSNIKDNIDKTIDSLPDSNAYLASFIAKSKSA